MKKLSPLTTLRRAAVVLAACAAATGALAATTAHYFDGDTQRTITLDTSQVAIITPTHEAGSTQARSVGEGSAPLVQLQPANQSVAKGAGTHISPVYREGNSPAGRLMALPGGVIVKFNADWSDAQVRAWAQAKGLTATQRLGTLGNWYIIATAPGSAALELANSLKAGGEVLAAMPNWWKQTAAR
ncbi:hypothetical protein PMI14_05348 [Acidovorax sp. CF316]|uniref:hypothetical protein n=1 Tax=Acidovorax sp. CF316 TaxID=1144317 RepID=UPI00026BD42C|nr:hypothetical protein [Acidovorax sp. CF316]EJE50062.1 hypothetical protein PMI14_05348 [Acidovorax sp. CF316]